MRRTLILALMIVGSAASAVVMSGGSIRSGGGIGPSGGGGEGGGALSATYTGPCEVTDTNADASDDCYCTRVSGNGADGLSDALYDDELAGCDDYDHPEHFDITDIVSKRPGDPDGYRGMGNRWQTNYPTGGSTFCLWQSGEPSDAGCTGTGTPWGCCTDVGEGDCPTNGLTSIVNDAGPQYWMPNDDADANWDACLHFQAAGMVDDENAGITMTGGNAGTGDVFSGNAHLFERVAPLGRNKDAAMAFEKLQVQSCGTELGVTLARAYPTNLQTAHPEAWSSTFGMNNANWKGDQINSGDATDVQFPEGHTGCRNPSNCDENQNPPFAGANLPGSNVANAIANLTVLAGNITRLQDIGWSAIAPARPNEIMSGCNGNAKCNQSETFHFATDWGLGEWGCVRWYMSGIGVDAATGEMWMEFQGPDDSTPRRLIHFTDVNMAELFPLTSGQQIKFDNNYNPGGIPAEAAEMDQSLGRYEDNFHARCGVPVSCQQIGFPAP